MRFYNDKINKYFFNPKHSGVLNRKLSNVYSVEQGNLKLGKLIHFQIMLDDTKSYIKDVKYKAYGCGVTIATLEWLSESIINKDISILDNIKLEDVNSSLELPSNKLHCALTIEDILKKFKSLIISK